MMKKAVLGVVALAFLGVVCHQALLVAPPGSTMQLFANPTFIAAHGQVSIITAVVIEPAGTPVADGTVVQCVSNLGRVDEQGKTNDGLARMNFISDSRSGQATITCFSGGAPAPAPSASPSPGGGGGGGGVAASLNTASTVVNIGSALPANIFLSADPPRITESRSTHIFATVLDGTGNPVANAPVFFDARDGDGPSLTEFMDVTGAVYTDQNGVAENVMRTRRLSSGTARVRARTPRAAGAVISETIDIPIVF